MSEKKRSAVNNQPSVIPPRFLERMAALLGDEYPAFATIYDSPPTHGLRVNTLKLTPAQFEAISPFPLSPITYSPAGFLVSDEDRPGKHPYHAAGLYYLQDPHAQAVAEILAPQPGERVLDLAAAPGGKTTHLASLMQNQGLLVANEIKTKRVGHLVANLERWGVHNTAIVNETPERLAAFFGPFFDRVLVDAPCSGEGMFRKDRAAIEGWSEAMIAGCAVRQTAILHYAARLVRPGGWLCYSTCTFAPEEDEAVVGGFLEEHTEFESVETSLKVEGCRLKVDLTTFNFQPFDKLRAGPATFNLPLATRLWPHTSPGEGHFVALMRKTGRETGDERPRTADRRRSTVIGQRSAVGSQRSFDAFCRETLADVPETDRVAQIGARLYALPEGLPDLGGLRVVHPGWWLGMVKKDRFEPAHALAMGLAASGIQRVLTLPADSPEVQAYLRGMTLRSDGEAGWMVVAVALPPSVYSHRENTDGGSESPLAFPLGWGKRVQGIVKNHYPRGLQWL